MKVKFTICEVYPFYEESESGRWEIDISEEKLKWIRETMAEYQRVHEFLADLMEEED